MVWMRAAALRDFRKLWGRIETDIPANATINVQIQNRYLCSLACTHVTGTAVQAL